MGGARVEQRQHALPFDQHWQQHGVRRPNTCKSMEGDCQDVSNLFFRGGGLLQSWRGRISLWLHSFLNVVVSCQVEKALAHMARGVEFITVVAEPLAATLLLLCRC